MQTVNPSLLEKTNDSQNHVSLKHDTRRDQGNLDILQRARQMGMKIWALEKLQRMITTINENDFNGRDDTATRSKTAGGASNNARGENDLSRVLRQEALNGPSDRDPLSSMEMIVFKGPFIYIHDMNEKTKPVMVREYSRVNKRQDGTWPQFRSAPLGKCPFIDEPPSRREVERNRIRQARQDKKDLERLQVSIREAGERLGREKHAKLVTGLGKSQRAEEKDAEAEIAAQPVGSHERKSSESFIPPHFPRTGPFYPGHEPAASGVQPSNVTSAIRSQMISSTAAAPGAKAGLSKEVHGLKRKVLEKGTGNMMPGTMAAPQRPNSGSTATSRQPQPGKSTEVEKTRTAPKESASEAQGTGTKRRRGENEDKQEKKPERKRDPKPGYCENCRDKFDDFEEVSLPACSV